jgi:D-tyrosyl-tRNA(Tyr) deacylase
MRLLIQRVRNCTVQAEGGYSASIGYGLLAYVGLGLGDSEVEAAYLAEKLVQLRIFEDEQGKMNLSALQCGLEIMLIPQFTLYATLKKGTRPDFMAAMPPGPAEILYEKFVGMVRHSGLRVATGRFRAHMDISYTNDGPVTILLERNPASFNP